MIMQKTFAILNSILQMTGKQPDITFFVEDTTRFSWKTVVAPVSLLVNYKLTTNEVSGWKDCNSQKPKNARKSTFYGGKDIYIYKIQKLSSLVSFIRLL